MILPKYLTRKDGLPKRPPRRLAYLFRCDVPGCGAELTRADTFWVCPKSLSHGKAIPDAVLIDKLRLAMEALGYVRWTAEGIWHIQRRIQWWLRQNIRLEKRRAQLVGTINSFRDGRVENE